MESYDPDIAPEPAEWLTLSERERLDLIEDYHESIGEKLPSPMIHAGMHATVETQIAMGDALPVAEHFARLRSEGLSRHDAIHAVGSVLSEHLFALVRNPETISGDPNQAYFKALSRFTAAKWLAG